ncbi:MAG: hypothetical protein HY711_03205 [Candidatus Melainabacteria bacterium]|nr:hypothetical protein [Candidatus Melainabacteria bacterium]
MGRKADMFYSELLEQQLVEAINNDFGKAILRLPNQGLGEVRDEVFVYFSAMAMQQVNVIAAKHGIIDPGALSELYQLTRANLIQGFRIGQSMRNSWLSS